MFYCIAMGDFSQRNLDYGTIWNLKREDPNENQNTYKNWMLDKMSSNKRLWNYRDKYRRRAWKGFFHLLFVTTQWKQTWDEYERASLKSNRSTSFSGKCIFDLWVPVLHFLEWKLCTSAIFLDFKYELSKSLLTFLSSSQDFIQLSSWCVFKFRNLKWKAVSIDLVLWTFKYEICTFFTSVLDILSFLDITLETDIFNPFPLKIHGSKCEGDVLRMSYGRSHRRRSVK